MSNGMAECPFCFGGKNRDVDSTEDCYHCGGEGVLPIAGVEIVSDAPPAKASDTPTEAGWYWFEGASHTGRLYSGFVQIEEYGVVSFSGTGTWSIVQECTGTWYGPIDVERIKATHSGHEEVDPVYGVRWAQ